MNFPKHIHTVFFTLIILNVIACGGFKSKNHKATLITKLLNIINSKDVDTYVVSKNGRLKRLNSKFSKKVDIKDLFHNRLLVKRLVPHGYGVSGYEYDDKFNTVYKPLVRVHGGKPRYVYKGKVRNDFVNRGKNKRPKNVRNVLYRDDELLKPFQYYKPKTVTFKSILEDVQSYVRKLDSTANMKKLKYAILGLLENNPKVYLLRHRFQTESEERDKHNLFIEEQNMVTQKPKPKWNPEYSYWNYWTYDKSIHQDMCKGKLVQLGNVCVETPPH